MSESEVRRATVDVVAAYVSNNTVQSDELCSLLQRVYETLKGLDGVAAGPEPAVPIEESVTDDYIICLEDGEQVTLLKRYLKTHHNMTEEEYREKWGLPEDYPFVAANYSKQRSEIAKKHGLGKS